MEPIIKNVEHRTVLTLADEVEYLPGQIVSKTLSQNNHCNITLFAFDKGEEISMHESNGDAFAYLLDGTGRLTVGGVAYELHAGEAIVMPAQVPHSLFAIEKFKLMVTVVFP